LALKVEPRFDSYVFIERNPDRCHALRALSDEFPDRADRIRVQEGEANTEIRAICAKNWKAHRAVLFLDPYGMQVEWSTIEAVAKTKAIDLWLLFPLGIGVNRLVTRSGEIPDGWKRRLDLLLGTSDWFEAFYQVEHTTDLFGSVEETVTKRSIDVIARYFEERLRSVFPAVATPGVLRNSANCPLYLLCFAASNERGAKPALRIANHLLRDIR
jgi:three-Cys-motif partner protein